MAPAVLSPAVLSLLCLSVWMQQTRALSSGSLWHSDTSEPPVNHTVVLHDYMVFLYQTLSKLQRRDLRDSPGARFANTVTSFVDQGEDWPFGESGQHYIFDLASLPRVDELVQAELRILRKPAVDVLNVLTTGGNLYSINLHSCSPDRQLLDSRIVEVLDGGLPRWEVFDVWSSIQAHQRNPTGSTQICFHLLALSELTNRAADPLLLGLGRQTGLPQEKALLVAFSHADTTDDLLTEIMRKKKNDGGGFQLPKYLKTTPKRKKKHLRHNQRSLSKRSFGGTDGGSAAGRKTVARRTRCSRKPLHVSFKSLGWEDWIIAPLDYQAHHCVGVCDFPLRSHLEPTNHAAIQTLINSIDPHLSPPSCCVPSKLSPISILYVDSSNNVVYKQYDDMVVESCGCR